MTALRPDLSGSPATAGPVPEPLDPQTLALVRSRLHAALALVQGAPAMPWPDMLTVIREDNAFRRGKGLLPPEEGEALWAVFDREMDRLYAVMNEGKEMDPAYADPAR